MSHRFCFFDAGVSDMPWNGENEPPYEGEERRSRNFTSQTVSMATVLGWISIPIGALGYLFWALLGQQLNSMNDRITSNTVNLTERIQGLESGRTTPMSNETRYRLEIIKTDMQRIEEKVDRIDTRTK